MLDNYLTAIRQHSQECLEDLDSFAVIAAERHLNRIERRAAERVLQVLIEACIGVAKYWLKVSHKVVPLDAYESFSKLAELQQIPSTDAVHWRKIIGMRNALVHDYLKIDYELVHALLSRKEYRILSDFIAKAIAAMESNDASSA